jgi:hypothetical protein
MVGADRSWKPRADGLREARIVGDVARCTATLSEDEAGDRS